jgi:hypothetical protein
VKVSIRLEIWLDFDSQICEFFHLRRNTSFLKHDTTGLSLISQDLKIFIIPLSFCQLCFITYFSLKRKTKINRVM